MSHRIINGTGYGSGIAKRTKFYLEYKNKSKFIKFVDK